MNQQSFFPIEPVDPAEVERPDDHAARLAAALAFNDDYLRRFYRIRLPEILSSNDVTRIQLFLDWWIEHRVGEFYEGYSPDTLTKVESCWLWIAMHLHWQEMGIDGDMHAIGRYHQAVRWHIQAVGAILEK